MARCYCWSVRIFLIAGFLAGFSGVEAEAVDYFPLTVGNTWTYRPSFGEKGDRVDTILGTETVDGTLTYIWNRQEAPDDNYNEKRWYTKEDSFVKAYRIWSNEGLDPPVNITPPWRVFKLNPVVDDKWEDEVDIGPLHVKVTNYVRSTTDSITVAAGSFNNCIRVQELFELTEGGATQYEYEETIYAPGVGPIIYRDYTENWTTIDFSQELVGYSISKIPLTGLLPLLLDDGTRVPVPGEWSGSADFGTLSFPVNSTSTGIGAFRYNFSDFDCGGVVRNGGLTIIPGTPWPIIDNQFTFKIDPDANLKMTITGTFEKTGRHASGTWKASSNGTTCASGTWEASPL